MPRDGSEGTGESSMFLHWSSSTSSDRWVRLSLTFCSSFDFIAETPPCNWVRYTGSRGFRLNRALHHALRVAHKPVASPNPPASKLAPIRNGRGEVTGHIRLYWSPNLQQYVSIPGSEIA